jgi:hypothetical protein
MMRKRLIDITMLSLLLVSVVSCSHRTAFVRQGLLAESTAGEARSLVSRLVLVGDAGEIGAQTLDEIEEWSLRDPEITVTLYLGDNMYPEGMTLRHRDEADRRLRPQIRAATNSGADAVFVPGNHDWADGGDGGLEAILAQAQYVNSQAPDQAVFLPSGGCPGPVVIDRYEGVRIIVLDTEWWLYEGEKPSDSCSHSNTAEVITSFARSLDTDRHVVVAAHHPLFGYGRHAGFSDWRSYFDPPVIGSFIALSRLLPLRVQDYNSSQYGRMAAAFLEAFRQSPGQGGIRVWAAGHEHNLQVLEGAEDASLDYVLISGAAAKTTPVNHGEETIFAQSSPGFMVLDIFSDSRVLARVVETSSNTVFPFWLEQR